MLISYGKTDEGKIFISTSGTYMKIRCTGHVKSKQLAIQPLGTLTECYNYCGNTPGCKRSVGTMMSLLLW